jgi:transcriptional regulator
MYIPSHHAEHDIATMHALIQSRPLGTWITQCNGELNANHIPFLLDTERGEFGTLQCHVARANPVWSSCSGTTESLIVFHGTDAYITPSWYPSKHAHGKAVPTWNYAAVHAYGTACIIEDKAWLLAHLNRLTDRHESTQAHPWKISDAPNEYIDRMLSAIVGIEIPIARLLGKWKTSQNRSEADRLGVAAGLIERGDEHSRAMAECVRLATNRAV